jgi:hypothetical protein
VDCPVGVAEAFRDAITEALYDHRIGRPFPKIDWRALAEAIDPVWAAEFFDKVAPATVQPKRREIKAVSNTP